MGNWYTNITVSGPPQADVVAVLQAHDRHAYATPTLNGITVVFDRTSEDSGCAEELGDLAMTLSQDLRCPALAAAVFDDDVLLLSLYDRGAQVSGLLDSAREQPVPSIPRNGSGAACLGAVGLPASSDIHLRKLSPSDTASAATAAHMGVRHWIQVH